MILANTYLTYQITTLFTVASPEKKKTHTLFFLKKGFLKSFLHCVILPEDSSNSSDLLQPHALKDCLKKIRV